MPPTRFHSNGTPGSWYVPRKYLRLATSILTLCNLYFIIVCNLFNIIIAQFEYLAALKQVSELLTRIYVHVTRYKCSVWISYFEQFALRMQYYVIGAVVMLILQTLMRCRVLCATGLFLFIYSY